MFEILMFLVQVHTDVASVSKALLDRTLNALVEGVADEALQCFRTVKKFGMGGMLRVCFFIYYISFIPLFLSNWIFKNTK